jgi:rubrerythrin
MHWEFLFPPLAIVAVYGAMALSVERQRQRQTEFFRKHSQAKAVFSPSQRKWICTKCGQVVTDQEHGT